MKRIDLIRAMVRRARELGIKITFHEGGNHTIVTVSNCVSQIPRHTEIPYGTARKIVKDLEQEFGKRWLRV
jgi:hypothetical protein